MTNAASKTFRIALLLSSASAALCQAPSDELNTLLMHSTFKVWGPLGSDAKKTSFGTIFLMGMPIKGDDKHGSAVLVTAGHVLDEIGGDIATLLLRRKGNDGVYTPFTYDFKIRDKASPLYTKHPTADVAVMYINLPDEKLPISVLPPEFLVDDARIDHLELHPGDEVLCLGFPLFAHAAGGFPFLRGGRLASYPLSPMKTAGAWTFDAQIFPGNSGGPVYFHFANRQFGGATHIGSEQGILGLVIQEIESGIPDFKDKPLNYGVIVPAQFIREALDKLPPESPYK